jgi:hypothetical protein
MFLSYRFIKMQCEISGSHDGVGDESALLGSHKFSTGKKTAGYFCQAYCPNFFVQTHGTLAIEEEEKTCSITS